MSGSNPGLVRLGLSDIYVSRMGIGAMTWGDPALVPRFNPARLAYGLAGTREEQLNAVDVSLAAGINFIDTAAMYGNGASELRVGELTLNNDMVIATKFPHGFQFWGFNLPKDLDESLKRLQRNSVELYQVHYPFPALSIPKIMDQMADAVQAGKIKAVGVSNFSESEMRKAHSSLAKRGIPLASNQVEYSLLHRNPEKDGVLAACHELQITLIAYMPLSMGALTGKYSASVHPAGFRRRMKIFGKRGMKTVEKVVGLLSEIGQTYSKSPAQVALRWLIEQENVIPIPGAKNGDQAAHNAGALTFTLTPDEVETLRKATIDF